MGLLLAMNVDKNIQLSLTRLLIANVLVLSAKNAVMYPMKFVMMFKNLCLQLNMKLNATLSMNSNAEQNMINNIALFLFRNAELTMWNNATMFLMFNVHLN